LPRIYAAAIAVQLCPSFWQEVRSPNPARLDGVAVREAPRTDCPARLLAALTPTQANLAGDSTFVRVRMGRQGRWPNAWAAGRGTERGRSSLGQWSSRAVLQVPER